MRKIIRKFYLSILITLLCAITLSMTTFAWIGLLTSSSIDNFQIGINVSDLQEYGIELSLTGEEGSFSTSINQTELKKEILKNYGINTNYYDSEEAVNFDFNRIKLDSCSVEVYDDNTFSSFLDVENKVTTKYFKFDIYISAFKTYESGSVDDYNLDAYLTGNLFSGTIATSNLINEFIYPSDFVNNGPNALVAGVRLKEQLTVDSSSACRLAIQKHNVVEKGHPELYENYDEVIDYVIYQGGTAMPTYDPETKVYSFGGILEEKNNVALAEYNKKFPYNKKLLPEWALKRNDLVYDVTSFNQIIDSKQANQKVTTSSMMKMTISFWFEGWDADCFDVINNEPVTLNLNFSNYVS